MPTPTQRVVERFRELLTGDAGLKQSVAALRDVPESILLSGISEHVGGTQAGAELREKSGVQRYPSFEVFVERIHNRMTEKFRRFSGTVEIVTEVMVSRDRIEGLTEELQFFVDTVTDVVERNRGTLGEGMTLSGVYEVKFEPVKKGGLHYQQLARIRCDVDLSRH